MKEQLISFGTAKLAKERGFDIKTDLYYYHGSFANKKQEELVSINWKNNHLVDNTTTAAPTQSLLQKWLRDKHDIIIEIQFDTISFGYRIFNPTKSSNYFTSWKWDKWTYEEALEVALQEALKLI